MKTLSLTQPWASLIASGEKTFETRSWNTSYTGPLAIHASKTFPGWAKRLCTEEKVFYDALRPHGTYLYPELTLGVVVCVTSLLYCIRTEDVRDTLSEKELAFGDYADHRWAWKLGPILKRYGMAEYPRIGHLGLWNCDWNGDHPA